MKNKNSEFLAERDHRVIGEKLEFFSSAVEVGQGLVMWNPKGAMVRYLLEKFSQEAHILNGYQWVYTPHIGKKELWETSGHLDFYKDSMYNSIQVDEEEYLLKPMSCPFHIMVYKDSKWSYRELPVRYAEYATVYRYELSGTLQGLTRVRGFTQDDAHIICTPDQMYIETLNALKFSLYILRAFGFEDFTAYIATKPEKKCIGKQEDWDLATDILKKAVMDNNLKYEMDEGGGAFYGPKIDIKLRDVLGREWQCSTIQFDFNLPDRFKMSYIGKDGKNHIPMMIHRALFGSIERFFALLVEHYNGEFPLWLAPVQIGIVPINKVHNEYCEKLENRLKRDGLRVLLDRTDDKMRAKIRNFEIQKIPIVIVIGDNEVRDNMISMRIRKDGTKSNMNFEDFLKKITPQLNQGKPQYIF